MTEAKRKGVIFDGDDTLWETMPLYTEAKQRFYDLMAAAGFDRGTAEERFEAIDHANVERFGFSQVRTTQGGLSQTGSESGTVSPTCQPRECHATDQHRTVGTCVVEFTKPAAAAHWKQR